MLKSSLVFILSLVMSLGCGYFSFCYFREKKTGVKSKFLPDRNTLSQTKKSTGFSSLVGLLGLVLCLAFCGENLLACVCCALFVAVLSAVGFADEYLTDIKGRNLGVKMSTRLFVTALSSVVLGIALVLAKQNTITTLPFVVGGVRLGWGYPLYVCGLTLAFTEGSRCVGDTKGAEYPMTFVTLASIVTLSALNGTKDITFTTIFLGLVAGLVWWTYPPCLVKTALGDKFACCGIIISACVLTSNESFLWFAMCFEIICLVSKPVDKLFSKAFSKHIFVKLPLAENFKSIGFSDKKIYLTCTLVKLLFCVIGIASVWLVNLIN